MTEAEQLRLMVRGTGNRYVLQALAAVLLAMSQEELDACPSRVELGRLAQMTERSVRRGVRHLTALGAVREERRPGNRRRIYPDVPRLAVIAGLL
jgi:hypothetical protein